MDDTQRRLQKIHDRELDSHRRAYLAGNRAALPAALLYCRRRGCAVPDWLLRASYMVCISAVKRSSCNARPTGTTLEETSRDTSPGKRGSHKRKRNRRTKYLTRARQDLIDYLRWDHVTMIRTKQIELPAERKALKSARKRAPWKSYIMALNETKTHEENVGVDIKSAFEHAADLLRGTAAEGQPSSMKRSYDVVRQADSSERTAMRYFLLNHQVYRDLGLGDVHDSLKSNSYRIPVNSAD